MAVNFECYREKSARTRLPTMSNEGLERHFEKKRIGGPTPHFTIFPADDIQTNFLRKIFNKKNDILKLLKSIDQRLNRRIYETIKKRKRG